MSEFEPVGYKSDLVRPSYAYSAATLTEPLPAQPLRVSFSSIKSLKSAEGNPPPPIQVSDAAPAESAEDPELGVLRLQPLFKPPPSQPPIPNLPDQSQTANQPRCRGDVPPDPELGCILIPPPPPPPRQPTVYLLARFDYFRSSNIYSAIDPIDDGLARPGITLYAAPRLGPNTFLTASVTGNLVRYSTQTQINYNELVFEASIFQVLSPSMFGRIGWTNQRLFIASDDILGLPKGRRFLDDHAIRLEISRKDQITSRLYLNTFYQLRAGFANPRDRSRIINSFIASLNYDIQPTLQFGLDYQFALASFTHQPREDQFQQVGVHLAHTMFRNTQIYLFVGYSFGRSSAPLVDFDGLVFGVSLSATLGLF
ncbi:hypothetical protein [Leptothermofonsia sp. ETS-13]|uniref:hypothetical protein n=1 Tax=Leptothermofonsia sp. ETS-13 TaxID=3035696 RepID=UPI003BA12F72